MGLVERDIIEFGSYWYTSTEKRNIEWIVVKTEGARKLLLSRYILDILPYNNKKFKPITWEECSLREWLNKELFTLAFNDEERERICTVKLKNRDNTEGISIINGGNSTEDKIFLLDKAELENIENDNMICSPTPYARDKSIGENVWWWTRSVSANAGSTIYVRDGKCAGGITSHNEYIGVRPAMWVCLGKEKYQYVKEEREYIYLGSYYQNSDEIKEDIKWRVLKKSEGGALIASCNILDYQPFDIGGKCIWKDSSIRKWLNCEFLNSAFDEGEKKRLKGEIRLLTIDEMLELFDGKGDRGGFCVTEYVKGKSKKCLFSWLYSDKEGCNPSALATDGSLSKQGICSNYPQYIIPTVWIEL